jgi:hypothetical protein
LHKSVKYRRDDVALIQARMRAMDPFPGFCFPGLIARCFEKLGGRHAISRLFVNKSKCSLLNGSGL